MSFFQKLFGASGKETTTSVSTKYDSILQKCNLGMASDEIAAMHKMLNVQGEKEGGAYYFPPEYVAAWESFRGDPTIQSARVLLTRAPQLLHYFEMCTPGSSFYSTSRHLRDQGL